MERDISGLEGRPGFCFRLGNTVMSPGQKAGKKKRRGEDEGGKRRKRKEKTPCWRQTSASNKTVPGFRLGDKKVSGNERGSFWLY